MSASLGRVIARLAQPAERISADLIDLINRNVNPPSPVGSEDVFIRAMYVVSDEVNSFGGRFPVDEHDRLVELLVDSPVMVGHRKDKLPIARNFHAATVEREGRRWVKSYFYWLKSAQGADNLRENIDGGIYKECSIGFTFLFPQCSICGKDIRTCEHEPMNSYEIDGETAVCHFNYRQIERVLETSLVYRGAVNDTSVSRELRVGRSQDGQPPWAAEPVRWNDLAQVDAESEYLVTPFYRGLMVRLDGSGARPTVWMPNGEMLPEEVCQRFDLSLLPRADELYGLLVPYRGKERLGLGHLGRLLEGRTSAVSRLEIKLIPYEGMELSKPLGDSGQEGIKVIRYEIVSADKIDAAARALMTREGVRIWPLSAAPPVSAGFHFRPNGDKQPSAFYQICGVGADSMQAPEDNRAVFKFGADGGIRQFVIRQFDASRLARGSRFVADELSAGEAPPTLKGAPSTGRLVDLVRREEGYLLRLAGELEGTYGLKRIRLGGRQRFLFYRVDP